MTSEAEELACRCENHANQCHDAQLAWVLPARLKAAAAMIRRLEKERDEARNKALDEVEALRDDYCSCYSEGAETHHCRMCELLDAILALKTQEPKPSMPELIINRGGTGDEF